MTRIVFYEKPGCINNTKQKRLLLEAGAQLDVRNLLTEGWTSARLSAFFQGKPIPDWFNKSAPSVKAGIINPAAMNADNALMAMAKDPLLIRRPLIEYGEFRCSGFDWPNLATKLNLAENQESQGDLETCPRQHQHSSCATPEASS